MLRHFTLSRKAIRLIDDPVLTGRLPSLAYRRAVGDLSLLYRYFHRLCSEELASIIPPLAVRSRVTRGALHRHPCTVQLQKPRTSHYLRSFIPRVSRLWNSLPAYVSPFAPNLQFFKSCINRYKILFSFPSDTHSASALRLGAFMGCPR